MLDKAHEPYKLYASMIDDGPVFASERFDDSQSC